MTTSVINLAPVPVYPNVVYVGRAGRGQTGYFGNPYTVGEQQTLRAVLQLFASYAAARVQNDTEYRLRVRSLKGKTLACFCVENPWQVGDPGELVCHAQILAMMAEKE